MAEPHLTVASLAERLGAVPAGDDRARRDELVLDVTHDAAAVQPGWVFCAVEGRWHDGHDFAADAVAAGAAALVVARPMGTGVPELVVPDTRVAMATAAAAVHGEPSHSLSVVGVTGTNGKTTVVSILGHLLATGGVQAEVIGTLTGARTTPESTDLQRQLAGMRDRGVTHVAMEVSSHALALHRVDAVAFDVAVFTNLGEDHLDFHGTPEAYFAAKATLFERGRAALAVVNTDDVRGRLLRDAAEIPVVGFSVSSLTDLRLDATGATFTWHDREVQLPLPGRHSVANALAAAEAALAVGLDEASVLDGLAAAPPVPGRFEAVDEGQDFTVVVDYAHTPDALDGVIRTARDLAAPGGRVVVVFGCGGDRDTAKRPRMGRVVTAGADVAVLTTDNPRSEDPGRIVDEVQSGCVREPVVEPDRRAAIRRALASANTGDVVVIAGKGHEQGQQFADRTEPFDDREVAAEELRAAQRSGGGAAAGGTAR